MVGREGCNGVLLQEARQVAAASGENDMARSICIHVHFPHAPYFTPQQTGKVIELWFFQTVPKATVCSLLARLSFVYYIII